MTGVDSSRRPLVGGGEAYPAMLEAIEGARTSVTLLTYIFDNDGAGRRFLAALRGAVERGGTSGSSSTTWGPSIRRRRSSVR